MTSQLLTIEQINALDRGQFVERLPRPNFLNQS